MWDDSDSDNFPQEGPCSKLSRSLGMMCLGIVAFPLSLLALAWNENHYACNNARILFAESKAVDVGCDSSKVMDKFAFLSCPLIASSLQAYSPCRFNHGMACADQPPVSFNAPSSKQVVEMYQCVETSCVSARQDGDASKKVRKCTYGMGWSQQPHLSFSYQHGSLELSRGCPDFASSGENPPFPNNLQQGESTDYAQTLLIGTDPNRSFVLGHDLLRQLSPDSPVDLSGFTGNFSSPPSSNESLPWARPLYVKAANLRVSGSYLETCSPPYRLGCVRIQYFASTVTRPSVLTHVGYAGATEAEIIPSSWGCKPAPWQKISPDRLTKEEMIEALRLDSKVEVWLIRIGGCLAVMLAVFCCLRPFAAAADVLGDCIRMCPCGGIVETALEGMVDWILCVFSCNMGIACSLLAIAAVWLYLRPLYSAGLLVAAVCCFCGAVGAQQSFAPEDFDKDME